MTKAKLIEKNDSTIVLEIEDGYSAVLIELPGGFDPESFFKATEAVDISKQAENEHSCSHAAPSKFDKFRVEKREYEEKSYKAIYGRVNETNRWETAAFGYPANVWEASVAKEHGKAFGGIAFQSAVAKKENEEKVVEGGFIVKKADSYRHIVYGIFLESNVVDTQKDIESPLEIEKAAHKYMYNLWLHEKPDMLGAQHEYPISNAIVIESFIAPVDFWYPESPRDAEHLVKAASWVVAALIEDNDEFEKVLSGDYTGFSVQGKGARRPLQ